MLIPAYNAAATIGEAIESALSQRPAPLEVIVSDDGSEDDLPKVLGHFGERLRVIRGPNRGLPTARNRAACAAQGQLLGLLDADDVWLPGRADALITAASARPDLSILTTDAVIIRHGVREPHSYYAVRHFDVTDQEEAILRNNFVFGAGAVRPQALRSVGGYHPQALWAEDWDLWLRLLLRGHRAGLVQAVLYEYRQQATNSLTAQTVDLAIGVLAALQRAHPLASDGHRASVLAQTQREWRVIAARSARAVRDPRRRRLAIAAVRGGGQPAVRTARLLAGCVIPNFRRSSG